MKLVEIDYVMANGKATVQLVFNLPYVCFERSLLDRTPSQCFKLDYQSRNLSIVSSNEYRQYQTNHREQNETFTFPPVNKFSFLNPPAFFSSSSSCAWELKTSVESIAASIIFFRVLLY